MTRLALVMIARDEARSIARALESARPHVDAMIVLDTGSADDTAAIARACGAQVYGFAWCDDFAAARNAALAHSDADWNLVLDADEWIEDATGLSPLALETLGPRIGQVQVASRMDAAEAGEAQAWIPRLLPRGVTYEGRIHEQPASPLPQARLPVRIGHDGYLAEQLARKADRNEVLLTRELKLRPDDAYLWLQLAREHQVRGRPAQAATCFAEALKFCPPGAPYRHGLVVRAITALKDAGRIGEARELADAEVHTWPQSPDFFFAVGDLYLECATREPGRALDDFLPIVEFAWKKCLEIGERGDLDGAVSGRGSHMAAYNLAVVYGGLGLKDLEREYLGLAAEMKRRMGLAA